MSGPTTRPTTRSGTRPTGKATAGPATTSAKRSTQVSTTVSTTKPIKGEPYEPSPRRIGEWLGDRDYQRYLVREATSLLLGLYALWLLVGLLALAIGPAAFELWRAAHHSPWSYLAHLLAFAAALYHAVTWIRLLPLTMPPLFGGRLDDVGWRRLAWILSGVSSVALLLYLTWA